MAEYINIEEVHDAGKTKVFRVTSKGGNFIMGVISWYPAWRRYTFQPGVQTIFDAKCLTDISKFIDDLMRARKDNKDAS